MYMSIAYEQTRMTMSLNWYRRISKNVPNIVQNIFGVVACFALILANSFQLLHERRRELEVIAFRDTLKHLKSVR